MKSEITKKGEQFLFALGTTTEVHERFHGLFPEEIQKLDRKLNKLRKSDRLIDYTVWRSCTTGRVSKVEIIYWLN